MSERHMRYRAFLQTLQSTSVFLGVLVWLWENFG
jgi:hypothetical protein